MESQYQKEKQSGLTAKNVLSIVAAGVAALCFLFLMTYGISYSNATAPYSFNAADLNMAHLIFGNKWAGLNPGLFSAFIIMILAIGFDIMMNWVAIGGYLSILCFITSGILWFCTVPLYGNSSAVLGAGGWCLGVFNIIDAALVFVAGSLGNGK
jgi:hypothetical protein